MDTMGVIQENSSVEFEDLKWNVGHAETPRHTVLVQVLKISLQVTWEMFL